MNQDLQSYIKTQLAKGADKVGLVDFNQNSYSNTELQAINLSLPLSSIYGVVFPSNCQIDTFVITHQTSIIELDFNCLTGHPEWIIPSIMHSFKFNK